VSLKINNEHSALPHVDDSRTHDIDHATTEPRKRSRHPWPDPVGSPKVNDDLNYFTIISEK